MRGYTVLLLCFLALFLFENSLGRPSGKLRSKVSNKGTASPDDVRTLNSSVAF